MGNIADFPAALAACIQTGFLKTQFISGLESEYNWASIAGRESMSSRIGESMTFTRAGLRTPKITPSTAASYNSDLNNGMTTSTSPVEQFTIALAQYSDMELVNLLQKEIGLKDNALKAARTIGIQAIQSHNRLTRNTLCTTYGSGNTRVISGGTLSTTTAHVDDITGFTQVLDSAGTPVAVSVSNTLKVKHYDAAGALVQELTVTGVAADETNSSSVYYGTQRVGTSGQITYSTATLPVVGDTLIAVTHYATLRPNGKMNTAALSSGDVINMGLILDAVARLRSNNVPAGAGGLYTVFMSPTTERQLLQDPNFQLSFQGKPDAAEIRSAGLYVYAGCRFVRTVEAPVQAAGNGVNVDVHRVMVVGEEAIVEADWEGLDNFVAGVSADNHYIEQVGNILLVVRKPIDVLAQQAVFAWHLVTGFACGTDKNAGKAIIPTADDKVLHKRAFMIEHAAVPGA